MANIDSDIKNILEEKHHIIFNTSTSLFASVIMALLVAAGPAPFPLTSRISEPS
jgi:hypothetical protein